MGGSLRSSLLGGSEWLPGGFSWVMTFLLVSLSSLSGVIGSVCPDLLDFVLTCDGGVMGRISFSVVAPAGPLLALDDS